jgi:hypothetical protein
MVRAMRGDWSIPAADPVGTFLLVLVIGIVAGSIITSAPVGVVGAAVVLFALRMWTPFQQ